MKLKKFILLGLLCSIAGIISITILIWTSFLIFNYPTKPLNIYGKIIAIDQSTIEIINYTTNQISPIQTKNIFQFNPKTHQNSPITINDLSANDQATFFCTTINQCQLVKMPPISLLGVIENIDSQIITISSNSKRFSLSTNSDTTYLNQNKTTIKPDSIAPGKVIFIYSDYSASPDQTENIPTASIQIIE
jgi:hypothetical protein